MVREATETEKEEYGMIPIANHQTIYLVLDTGEIEGYIGLSFANGNVLAHNFECWSKDTSGAVRLWVAARTLARSKGIKEVLIHFTGDEPEGRRDFYTRLGAKKIMEIYTLNIEAKEREVA
jgi:hypothetical protein